MLRDKVSFFLFLPGNILQFNSSVERNLKSPRPHWALQRRGGGTYRVRKLVSTDSPLEQLLEDAGGILGPAEGGALSEGGWYSDYLVTGEK